VTLTNYQEAAWLALRHAADDLESASVLLGPSRAAKFRGVRQQATDLRAQVLRLAHVLDSERADA